MTARPTAEIRAMVADVLFGFAAGVDEGDADLLRSAFAPAASVDFGPCGTKLGMAFPPLEGREEIVGFLAATCVRQVTSHVVTNIRVSETDAGLTAIALVEATHVVREDPQRKFLMLDRYVADLGGVPSECLIERLVIDNVWFEGNPTIMLLRKGGTDATGA